MGMYTTLNNKDLEIHKREELELIEPFGSSLNYFLLSGDEIKFYGYWTEEYLEFLNKLGKEGILKGTIEITYEEGDHFICMWNEEGFFYKRGKIVYPEAWERT